MGKICKLNSLLNNQISNNAGCPKNESINDEV